MSVYEAPIIPDVLKDVWDSSPQLQKCHEELQTETAETYAQIMPEGKWDGSSDTVRVIDIAHPDAVDADGAVVVMAPFANGWKQHTAARVDMIEAATRDSEATTTTEAPKRVIFIPNNTHDESSIKLSAREHLRVAAGDFIPVYDRVAQTLDNLGIKKIHGILYSQGTAIGASVLALAAQRSAFEVGNSGFFEPPNLSDQSVAKLMVNFGRTGMKAVYEAMDDARMPLLRDSLKDANLFDMLASENLALAFGMSNHPIGGDLRTILAATSTDRSPTELLLMRASNSTVTARWVFEQLVEDLSDPYSDRVSSIEVPGNHGVGDNTVVHGLLAVKALRGVTAK